MTGSGISRAEKVKSFYGHFAKSQDTNYQAEEDGFAYVYTPSGLAILYVENDATPAITRGRAAGCSNIEVCFAVPVMKGWYYKSTGANSLVWIPKWIEPI